MIEDYELALAAEPEGEVVHWMRPRPVTVGPVTASSALVAAFVLGAAAALAVATLTGAFEEAPRRRGR